MEDQAAASLCHASWAQHGLAEVTLEHLIKQKAQSPSCVHIIPVSLSESRGKFGIQSRGPDSAIRMCRQMLVCCRILGSNARMRREPRRCTLPEAEDLQCICRGIDVSLQSLRGNHTKHAQHCLLASAPQSLSASLVLPHVF